MKNVIQPDPQHPLGGWSLLSIDSTPGTTVTLAIQELSSEQWLSTGGWQPGRTTLGDFEVLPTGEISLGPKIVDQIEPYTALEVTIDETIIRLTWPDTIAISPGSLRSGGLLATPRQENPLTEEYDKQALITQEQESDKPGPTNAAIDLAPREETRARQSAPLFLLGLLGVITIIALIAYFLLYKTAAPDQTQEPAVELEETACTPEDFEARRHLGYDDQMLAAVQCGSFTAPADLLRILETGVQAENPEALLRMARIYDPAVSEDPVLSLFRRDPAIAAEYYARAAAAGSTDIGSALNAVCSILDPENLLHSVVLEEYCP